MFLKKFRKTLQTPTARSTEPLFVGSFSAWRLCNLALRYSLAFVAACLLVSYFSLNAHAQVTERECSQRLKGTSIKVDVDLGQIEYDRSKNIGELTLYSGKAGDYHRGGNRTLGLNWVQLRLGAQWGSNSLYSERTGEGCMRPVIHLTLRLDPHKVFVANDFSQGSCAYREVMRHEMAHAAVNEKYLRKAANHLERSLRSHFGNQIFYGNIDSLQKQLGDAVQNHWMQEVVSIFDERKAEHARIDSPAEYAKNSTLCNGAMRDAANRYR